MPAARQKTRSGADHWELPGRLRLEHQALCLHSKVDIRLVFACPDMKQADQAKRNMLAVELMRSSYSLSSSP